MTARVGFLGEKNEIETFSIIKNRPHVEDFGSIGRTLALKLDKTGVALL